jgi:hypothetical protein
MVFAQAEDFNILHNHQLIMPLMEDCVVNNVSHILLVSLCKEQQSFGISVWCRKKAFAVGVLANAFENSADSAGELLLSREGLFRGFFQAFTGPAAYLKFSIGVQGNL